jgi:hypothetical protein
MKAINNVTNGRGIDHMKLNLIGVYALHLAGQIVYIGQAHCMRSRIQHYQQEGDKEFDGYSFANLLPILERMNYPIGKMYLDWVECWEIARAEPIFNRRIPKMRQIEMMMPVGLLRFCTDVSDREGVTTDDDFLRLKESLQTLDGRKLKIDSIEHSALCARAQFET